MASTSETGHAKNVANLEDFIAVLTGYGAPYNPTKAILKLPALNTMRTTSIAKISDVAAKNILYNNVVNDRQLAFSGIRALSTRLVNALEATDAIPAKIADIKGFHRKLQGHRASSPAQTSADPNAPAPATISVSQRSYDQQIEHFASIIGILASEPSYAPNENDLKIATLNAKKADLIAKNTAVTNAYVAITNSRISRDSTLYMADTGVVDVTTEVKQYVKSLFGAKSPQYAQLREIKFRKVG
ncbi:MAG TPA: hypothetical protein VF581_11905 [Flavobacterium sp.]|jgi:hypothetical protein